MNSRCLLSVLALAACAGLGWVGYSHWYGSGPSNNKKPPFPEEENTIVVMDEAQRNFIWEVEHHVLVLSKYWFKDFAQALQKADGKAMAHLLAPNFQGATVQKTKEEKLETAYATVVRQRSAGLPPIPLGAAEFISRLLDLRKPFIQPPHVKLYPKTMAPKKREDLDSPWE